ncbi:VRR-NUC domain-containing protein [Mycolicibacterium moriokaense]|nr:VRR-NUC domain-containing protein [Mycolicibacterium moriokaense]
MSSVRSASASAYRRQAMAKRNQFAPPVPYEDEEQATFVGWLELVGLKFTAIPNHTYNPHHSQQNKNRRIGLRKGLPDMVVVVPHTHSKDGRGHLLFIEMKRIKDSSVSSDQKLWIAALNMMGAEGVEAHVAKGANEAIAIVSKYIHPATNISPF